MKTIRRSKQGQRVEHRPPTEGEQEWLRMCSVLYHKLADTAAPGSAENAVFDAGDVDIPEFDTAEEYDAWCETLPSVEPDIDPRLLEKLKTSIRLSRKVIDGFNYLAEQKGIRSGQTLMKIVLENYLAKSLPPDF